jgi:quercetin dioxygenase-like cupin family protein
MTDAAQTSSQPQSAIPPDDPSRMLAVADPEAHGMRRVSVAGDTYTILLTGEQTAGRYTLIDMHVPPGGGPPPHRHDFEEMFTVLEGEIEVTFRGEARIAHAGSTLNIPANAPHAFKNTSNQPARLLCMCSPPGQEEFFMAVGDPVESRTAPPPDLSRQEQAERHKRAERLVARYRTEMVGP